MQHPTNVLHSIYLELVDEVYLDMCSMILYYVARLGIPFGGQGPKGSHLVLTVSKKARTEGGGSSRTEGGGSSYAARKLVVALDLTQINQIHAKYTLHVRHSFIHSF